MRGPGESPLQLRNEPMRRRIRDLRKKLGEIGERERLTRARRPWPVVCLVGYTNAGKSTMLNAFADADALVDDRLFATLDTKTRLVGLGGGRKVLMTDTVGFIRHLPHGLVASFRSTLGVASEADLLLVMADAGHPHMEDHLEVVQETLREIHANQVPAQLVLNKCDTLPAAVATHLRAGYPNAVMVSALRRTGLDEIRRVILERVGQYHGERLTE